MRTFLALVLALAVLLAGCADTEQDAAEDEPQDAATATGDPDAATGDPDDPTAAPDDPTADPDAELAPMPPFGTARITLLGPDGERVEMGVYVADTPDTRRQGLMGVTDLPRDAGMVFLTTADRDTGFWMKDTLLPLSIAYLAADGTVVSVVDMEPCEADPCPSYPPGATYRHALEVHQGRFDELGLDEGWRVELPT